MRFALVALFLLLFLTSCLSERCLIEAQTYSCNGFERVKAISDDVNKTLWEISYLSDGLKIKGIIAEPKIEGKLPLILFNHGGRHGLEEYNWLNLLADNGYVSGVYYSTISS